MHNIKTSGANLAHYTIIRRTGAQLTAQAAGAPTLRAGPLAFISSVGVLHGLILAPRAMVQALAGMLAFRNCSAPPGCVQEPPRPMVPPRWRWRWCSVLAVRGVKGGAA